MDCCRKACLPLPVGLEYMVKRRSTYGGRKGRVERGGEYEMCCVISKISDARIWRQLTLQTLWPGCDVPTRNPTLICLSGSAGRTDGRREKDTGWQNQLSFLGLLSRFDIQLLADGLFYSYCIETLHSFFFLDSRLLLYSPYPPSPNIVGLVSLSFFLSLSLFLGSSLLDRSYWNTFLIQLTATVTPSSPKQKVDWIRFSFFLSLYVCIYIYREKERGTCSVIV